MEIILAVVFLLVGVALAVSFKHAWGVQMRRARGFLAQDQSYRDELCKRK